MVLAMAMPSVGHLVCSEAMVLTMVMWELTKPAWEVIYKCAVGGYG